MMTSTVLCKCFNNVVASKMVLKESVDMEISILICMKNSPMEDKERQGTEGAHLLELQKVPGPPLSLFLKCCFVCMASSLMTVVSE